MARIRSIKPEFWTDEKVVQLPYEARLLFIGLWNFADDDGLLPDQPERVKLQILPSDQIDAEAIVDLLVAAGLLDRFFVDGETGILSIPGFAKHQVISHKTASKLPIQDGRKQTIPAAVRRGIAIKYGCTPGEEKDVQCYFCGAAGRIWWPKVSNGRPGGWVAFSGVEIDHFIPEFSGGETTTENVVLSCRYCNRSRGTGDPLDRLASPIWKNLENSGNFRPEGKGKEGIGRDLSSQGKQFSKVDSNCNGAAALKLVGGQP